MGKPGRTYGSKYHLHQYLDRHSMDLEKRVLSVTQGQRIEWLNMERPNAEWRGINFVQDSRAPSCLWCPKLIQAWKRLWPRNPQAWDAIGIHTKDGEHEWLLVEAKGRRGEMKAPCTATDTVSRDRIEKALAKVGSYLGVSDTRCWTGPYYQFANRLAALWFLHSHAVPVRLVYMYFLGDTHPAGGCPTTECGWRASIEKQNTALGLIPKPFHRLIDQRVHKIFLPVRGK